MTMDSTDSNGAGSDNRLIEWAARNAARRAARQVAEAPVDGELAERIAALDAEFADRPDREDVLAQENHELRRLTVIYEEAIRLLTDGKLQTTQSAV